MTERPILFNTDMVRATLNGYKTQTRRVIKGKWLPLAEEVLRINGKWVFDTLDYELTTPYGVPGDRLWVRETWQQDTGLAGNKVYYKADGWSRSWRPSIFMPRWASRINLLIKDIHVERVQDITLDDAGMEGVGSVEDYARLWDKLNAKRGYGWEVNPLVWVIEFEVINGL